MIKLDIFVTLTIFFGITSLVLGWLLWIARGFMIKLYGSVRHWLLRRYGWGFAYFYEPNKRLVRHYCKLNETKIHFRNGVYSNIPERQFDDFEGVRAISYNLGDAEPIDPYKEVNKSLQHDPKFWDKFSKLMRMYYQTQTNESLVFIMVLCTLGAALIGLGLSGFIIYKLDEIALVCASSGVVSI